MNASYLLSIAETLEAVAAASDEGEKKRAPSSTGREEVRCFGSVS